MLSKILVWDLPTRVFHWLLVTCFAGAFLTAESEKLQLIHLTLGYTFAGLLAFRLVWGLVGSRHARFSSFLPSPAKAWNYGLSLINQAKAPHYTGHNPLGALGIYALLATGILVAASGFCLIQDTGGEWAEEAHELAANGMLTLVFIHVAGVITSSLRHEENLVHGMLTGRKNGEASEAIRSALTLPGILLLTAVLGFWAIAYWQPQAVGLVSGNGSVPANISARDHDDDD